MAGGNENLLRDMRARCMIAVDPSCAIDAARVEVNLSNGATESVAIAHCRGSLARPMTDFGIELEIRSCTSHANNRCRASDTRGISVVGASRRQKYRGVRP